MKTAKFEQVAENDRYREARQRLADRTAAIEHRVGERLIDVQQRHDLDWRLLLASQREISRLDAAGAAPSPAEFWETEAAPKAAALTTAATLVIDSCFHDLEPAVSRFETSVSSLVKTVPVRGLVQADVATVLQPLTTNVLDDSAINELGERWQKRLRRHAIKRRLGSRITSSKQEFELIIAAEELVMIDQTPWLHGDRFLSAFEIAHGDVRALVRQRVSAASKILTSRPTVAAPITL